MQSKLEVKRFKKMATFDEITNTPSFYTAPGCFHHQIFALIYEALEACHVPCEEAIILHEML